MTEEEKELRYGRRSTDKQRASWQTNVTAIAAMLSLAAIVFYGGKVVERLDRVVEIVDGHDRDIRMIRTEVDRLIQAVFPQQPFNDGRGDK